MNPFLAHLRTGIALGLAAQFSMSQAAAVPLPNVDWKFYGGTESTLCFYEVGSLVHTKGEHVKVWAKCLRQKDLDAIDIETAFNGKILEAAAHRLSKHYRPPISTIEDFGQDQLLAITQYEVTANVSHIVPTASIFYELRCSERAMRELSISVTDDNGKSGYKNKPSDWRPVPPEGNGARLLRLLCR